MNYFELHDINCAYDDNKVVLRIESLSIPQGSIVFIVGQSGCGKSTILETLGLMNNTMLRSQEASFVFNAPDGTTIDYQQLWQAKHNNARLSEIRRRYFSFIFQQTNLMRNFNIYENIAITKMLQGANEAECKRTTNEILKKVALDEFVKMRDGGWDPSSKVFCRANEASGGQQQRMAFARAMVAEYSILFCDEPTGNLDPDTADLLMRYLHDEVKSRPEASAIIVSHDMNLATKYGDIIIKIFKKQHDANREDYYGYINDGSVFTRADGYWLHGSDGSRIATDEVISRLKKWDQ